MMDYYSITYITKDDETTVSIVKAKSWFDAEEKAKEDMKKWPGYKLYSVVWQDKKRIDAGEVVCVY